MSTIINFTDPTKLPITVNDGIKLDPGVSGNPTPLTFLGKKYPNTYSKDIAENFLHILENFASVTPPSAPVEGQLWFNTNSLQQTDTGNSSESSGESFGLKMRIGSSWLPIGIIKKSAVSPGPTSGNFESINLKKGDLYVDTSTNQLYIYNGVGGYSLVGPFFNALEKTGLEVEEIVNSLDNQPIAVITFFIKARRVAIYSDKTFVPKLIYEGFREIKQGFNLSKSTFDTNTKFWGISEKALSLIVGDSVVDASKFLRSDAISTTTQEFNVRSPSGINLGTDSTFNISIDSSGAYLLNKIPDSDIDFRIKKSNSTEYSTVIRVRGSENGRVGINKTNPQQALDINGNLALSGNLISTGRLVCKDLEVDSNIGSASLPGLVIDNANINCSKDLVPTESIFDLGSSGNIWQTLYVKQIGNANQFPLIYGNVIANQLIVGGIARTLLISPLDISDDEIIVSSTDSFPSTGTLIIDNEEIDYISKISNKFLNLTRTNATNHSSGRYVLLKSGATTFGTIDGYARGLSSNVTLTTSSVSDINFSNSLGAPNISFKDAGQSVTITTSLNSNFISAKPQLTYINNNDLFLIQSGTNFYKTSKSDLVNSLPVIPTGTILLYSGSLSNIPVGFLPCDGRELLQTLYDLLHRVIGEKYKKYVYLSGFGTGIQQFALPDLRNQVPNFKPKQLQYGLEYVITEVGNTNWSALGFTGTAQENSVFTASWGLDSNNQPLPNPGTGTGQARLFDGLHYIIYTGKI